MLNDPMVQEIITDITDDEANSVSIIKCIMDGKTHDEEIAEETDIRLNTVRKILYKLYDAGIASYKRSRDPETNWYLYTWKFESDKVTSIISKRYQKVSDDIEKSLEFEEGNMFFACDSNEHRYKFEEASENNFTCPMCGGTLEYQDNSSVIAELKNMLDNNSK